MNRCIGVVSDTHGLLRGEVVERLDGVSAIFHAGDIGDECVLAELSRIAPTFAVRGNCDRDPPLRQLPATLAHEIDGAWFYLLHDLEQLDLDPVAAGFQIVIAGHSHVPGVERRNGVLYLNPGSCGPRRPSRPISLALIRLDNGQPQAELMRLG